MEPEVGAEKVTVFVVVLPAAGDPISTGLGLTISASGEVPTAERRPTDALPMEVARVMVVSYLPGAELRNGETSIVQDSPGPRPETSPEPEYLYSHDPLAL